MENAIHLYFLRKKKVLYIPKGFAHGFCALGKENLIIYNISDYYVKNLDKGIIWNDKYINFNCYVKKSISQKKIN